MRVNATQLGMGLGGTLLVLAIVLSSAVAWANPCTVDLFAGRNVVSEGSKPTIAIEREDLGIEVHYRRISGYVGADTVAVTVSYLFNNTGDAADVVMGFPLGASVEDVAVEDFAISGTGVGPLLSASELGSKDLVETADLSLCERGLVQIPGHDKVAKLPVKPRVHWFLWRQHFEPGHNTLKVTYSHVAIGGELSLFHYFLQTAKTWGDGQIGRLRIEVKETGAVPPTKLTVEMFGARPKAAKRRRTWTFRHFVPTADIVLQLGEPG